MRQVRSLYWSKFLLTYKDLGRGGGDLPLANCNFEQAVQIAKLFSARLPTSTEWEWMAAGQEKRRYPWGNDPWQSSLANLLDSELANPTPVGSYPKGETPEGVSDVAGNLWEWTSSSTSQDGRYIRGASYNSKLLYAECAFRNIAPAELQSAGIGIRLVRDNM